MSSIIIEHAKNNVWQEPSQDHQFNIGLGRLTKRGGFIGSTTVFWHKVLSPTRNESSKKFHHLYQIGQVSPITLNLANVLEEDVWTPAQTIVNDLDVLIEVYFESGAIVPLSHVWLMRDFTKNLLICVRHNPNMDYGDIKIISDFNLTTSYQKVTCDNDRLITRFYSNSYQHNQAFNGQSWVGGDSIRTTSTIIKMPSDYSRFIAETVLLKKEFNNKGDGLWYLDGFLISPPGAYTSSMVDRELRFVWDETYKFKQLFNLKQLPSFVSEKDTGRLKYLLLVDAIYDNIDYYDDIDFYLVGGTSTSYKGVYLNRALPTAFHQITHNSYSVDAELVHQYTRQHEFLSKFENVWILIYARTGGMTRGVFSQANRIDELFRLPYNSIKNAFLNTDSLVKEWRAATLENSDYVKLMGASEYEITEQLVTDAYGYSGITWAVANPLQDVVAGSVKVPQSLNMSDPLTKKGLRTIFCYDASGLYLGYIHDTNLTETISVSKKFPSANRAECFKLQPALSSQFNGIYYNKNLQTKDIDTYGYRCYVCSIVNGVPSEEWTDATDSPFVKYIKGTGTTQPKLEWQWGLLTEANLACCIKVNKYILINNFSMDKHHSQGYMTASISCLHDWSNSFEQRTMTIPPAVVEVFCDGDQMIEGVDYYMDFPRIVINNHQKLATKIVNVTVRSYGCGDPVTCKPYKPSDVGFVTQGYLSVDGEYDISKNRTNKVVVNSRLVDKTKVKFSEYSSGQPYIVDGRPFMVQDYIVPIEGFSSGKTTEMYTKMCDTDKRLGKYLTKLIPDPVTPLPRAQTERWALVSPVMNSLLHRIRLGFMSSIDKVPSWSLEDIENWIEPISWLMEYDPAVLDLDSRWVHIRPHPYDYPMKCTIKQYQFLELVCQIYLNDRVDLSNFVQIGVN